MKAFITALTIGLTACVFTACAAEYHVSTTGIDKNPGTESKPFKTIMAAAKVAQPGDTITVGEGTYRESINPPRGGTGEDARITYRAAKGKKVVIKGSEIIKGWKQQGGGVWKAELGNSFFGDYNPYALILTGDWLAYGKWHHRGDIYLNGKAFLEKQKEEEVGHEAGSWFCRTDEKTTTIVANFGKSNPNKETVEINVRQGLFMPEISGLKYITVDGFHFLHDASNWAAPNRYQPGAVSTRVGKHWIIQNCTITDCRCVGIILGKASGVDYTDIDAYGDHIIRNNIIRRCGQSGIAGFRGATRSLIEGNLIEDTNYRSEFGGQETAAIKLHYSVDTIIKNNLIRRVNEKKDNHGAGGIGGFGIWIDANNQSFRITGNIVYDTELEPLFFEMNHGPILVDNNIIAGEGVKCIRSNSAADVFAHNLFVDCGYLWTLNNERIAHYYKPHTTKVVGRKAGAPADDKWYNNIFVRSGLDSVKKAEGYQSDYNLFLEGAKKSSFGDEHSIVDAHVTEFTIDERPNGVTVTFSAGDQQRQLEGPWVSDKLVGVFATSGQTIEDRYANPITVDTDITGEKRSKPTVGPLANLKSGSNSISWINGKIKKSGCPTEYHVSTGGLDDNPGTKSKPFKTIMAAAKIAQPGDTITVHEGVYRESISPPRGGTSEAKRIVYQAATGEKVTIKGSEIIKGWKQQGGGVWKAEVANSFFGDSNPYALKMTGGWLTYGKWHHRGDVYLNGKAFLEKEKEEEVGHETGSWFCRTDEKTTTIVANFGKSNPNKETVEINARESLFMPEITGLKYITVDGFYFLHAASNWSPPNIALQPGAVGTRMGKRWIIQNCTITDCRSVGIILGTAPGMDYTDIDAYGDHIIRKNIIRRCGQAGIAGLKGATRSLIEGNLIEDTNYRREFGGCETAAIKFHYSVDTVIKGNLIRGVFHQTDDAHGIWIDAGNQSFRITGNIIYNTDVATIYLEINHGPVLIDNNILIGKFVKSNSRAVVLAHNLFVNCRTIWDLIRVREAYYWTPHTTQRAGLEALTNRDHKWFNNIFVQAGLRGVKSAEGYQSDYNVFMEGAKKSSFGDSNSIVNPHSANFKIEDNPFGATITFLAGDQQGQVKGPWVNGKLVGAFEPASQTIEDRYGNPITVDTDITGKKRSKPTVGPLTNLKSGSNSISWNKGKITK